MAKNPLLLHEVNLDQAAMLQGNMLKPALCRSPVRLLRWIVLGFWRSAALRTNLAASHASCN